MITVKIKKIIIYFLLFFIIILYLANVENVSKSVFNSLKFCVYTLIPSLFPNLLISGLINDGTRGFNHFNYDKKSILGNCKIYKIPILTGMLCGFIVGPKAICSIYDNFEGDKNDFTISVALSSNAGIGFVLGCIGTKIWNDLYFGVFLYLCQILSAYLVFLFFKSKASSKLNKMKSVHYVKNGNIISNAIISAFNSLCIICSFYIFFGLVTQIFSNVFNFNANTVIILSTIFDFSSGVFKVFSLSNQLVAMFLTGFTLGFAGISVHLQTFFVCEKYPLNKVKFFFFKLLQGLLCGIMSLLYAII